MYLTSFSITQPSERYYLFYPGWLNVWEAHLYNLGLKASGAQGWAFKRFGTREDIYAREAVRKPDTKPYIDALEQVAETALQQMSAKERMRLMRARTAFIYADAWGETGAFEGVSSQLQLMAMDTLPKNLVRKFSVKDFTCKIRGERQSLMQALSLAQDYLDWQVFDSVVILCAWRAVPVLVFSETQHRGRPPAPDGRINIAVERAGCFILSRSGSGPRLQCGRYTIPDRSGGKITLTEDADISLFAFASAGESDAGAHSLSLVDLYGDSGCMTPALSWEYLAQHERSPGKMRTVVRDGCGGYNYFDTWY